MRCYQMVEGQHVGLAVVLQSVDGIKHPGMLEMLQEIVEI